MKKTILVVEAEPALCRKLRSKLSAQNYRVVCAGDTQGALNGFDLKRIELLLLDLDVPTPDGWSALPLFARVNPRLRVIGLTERSDLEDSAHAAGLSAVAEKPIDFGSLLRLLEEMLGTTRAVAGVRYVPAATVGLREKALDPAREPSVCPAAFSGWGIND